MEYYYTNEQHNNFLEELLCLREMENHYTNQDPYLNTIGDNNNGDYWHLDSTFHDTNNFSNIIIPTPNSSFFENNYTLTPEIISNFNPSSSLYAPFGDQQSPPDFALDSTTTNYDAQTVPNYQEGDNSNYHTMPNAFDGGDGVGNLDTRSGPCKMEPLPEMPADFNMGTFCPQIVGEKKNKSVKKINGQPSKNLMAERRRRKRLNDRLSMLRSVVPKISKMDRTSILGDTIDYMKELLERINGLQEEMHLESNQLSSMTIFNDVKPNEIVVRNSPKFDVERRNEDTRIEICCGGKPGLLLSTVTTLEALGLEIQQCVISCFNEFSLQASCSEELNKRAILDSEDIKQALLRNAGYGGRCL